MAVPSARPATGLSPRTAWRFEALGGAVGSMSTLAVIVTLGLLAWSPLGATAARVGLAASFVTAALGGLVYAAAGRAALPVAGPSSATALILASLVLALMHDPRRAAGTAIEAVIAGCAVAVSLSGLLQWLIGRLGWAGLSRLVPRPVLAGFMNGVALLIVVGQLPLLLGLLPGVPLSLALLPQAQPGAALLGLGTVLLIVLLHRARVRWPPALAALLLGSAVHALLQWRWPQAGVGPTIGPVAAGVDLPALHAWRSGIDLDLLLAQAPAIGVTAVVLALIGALESLLNLQAADQLTEGRHDPGRELRAIGLSNLVCGALGGLPVVMLRARAVAIHQAGGRGRRAAAAGSLALALLYVLGGPLLSPLPLPVLGAVMVTVAFGLVDRWTGQLMLQWWRGQGSADLRAGLLVMALVCGLTLWLGFAAGVAAGLLLSMLIFIARMNRSLLRARRTAADCPSRRVYPPAVEARLQPMREQIQIWELEGALFFGNADRLLALGEEIGPGLRVLVLDLRRVNAVDETGAAALATLSRTLHRRQALVLLAGLEPGSAPQRVLQAQGPALPPFPDADRAIEAAEQLLLGPDADSARAGCAVEDGTLLQGLDPAQVAVVRGRLREIGLAAGEALFRQGDPADGLYLLSQGSVSVIGRDGSSTQRFLSISPGMMLGEAAMLDGGGRSADAVADAPAVLHHLSQRDLQTLECEHPAIAARLHFNIARHLSARLRAASAAWWASQH